jgi:ABC-2 type transport system permease protein
MNRASTVANQSAVQTSAIGENAISWGRQMYWCVRREIWENRSIYMAPLAAAAVALGACLVAVAGLPERLRSAAAQNAMGQQAVFERPFDMAGLLIMSATFLVALFYCLDALYGERRDRSILFWKSLPVSDLTTVLAKAAIPIVVLPLLTFAVAFPTQAIVLIVTKGVLAAGGFDVGAASSHFSFWHASWMLLYHLVALHGLEYAPFYGWLLFVSAWARRLPILWATLPPAALAVFEKIAFNTSYFAQWLANQLGGADQNPAGAGGMSMDALSNPQPGYFLTIGRVWFNLLIAAIFLVVAARLRRLRGPL